MLLVPLRLVPGGEVFGVVQLVLIPGAGAGEPNDQARPPQGLPACTGCCADRFTGLDEALMESLVMRLGSAVESSLALE